ncbi:MAG: hypothetical protein R3B13_33435 [Polyangiaceae bacterium]
MRSLFVGSVVCIAGCAGETPAPRAADTAPVGSAPVASVSASPQAPPAEKAWKHPQYVLRTFVQVDDKLRGTVSGRRRVLWDGSSARLVDAEPVPRLGRATRIPDALGGGFVFVDSYRIYFAREFDGPLVSIAESDAPTGVEVGVGRSELLVAWGNDYRIYSLPSGEPAPPLPFRIRRLFGTAAGLVVAVDSKGKLRTSTPAAPKWKTHMTEAVSQLFHDDGGVVVETRSVSLRVADDGRLTPLKERPPGGTYDNLDLFTVSNSDVSRLLTYSSAPLSRDVAWSSMGGDVTFFDPRTGKQISNFPGSVRAAGSCSAFFGGNPSFLGCNVSNSKDGWFEIHRIEGPGKPVLERTFKQIFSLDFANPSDGVPPTFLGKCDGTRVGNTLCTRARDGNWREVPIEDPLGLLRSAGAILGATVSAAGEPYVLRAGPSSSLLIFDGKLGRIRIVRREAIPDWAAYGLLQPPQLGLTLPLPVTVERGVIRAVVRGMVHRAMGPGVLEIHEDDSVKGTAFDGFITGTGSHVLHMQDGALRESIDGGKTFRSVPPSPAPAQGDGAFCYPLGCWMGPWVRAGWSTET